MKQLSISTRITSRDTESFKKYLKEVSEIKLLTPEEEIICTKKASRGDETAIQELIHKNLRFVISVAKQYVNSNNPLEDLVNEGNIGLIVAVQHFKPEKGFKFISYAVWWIRKKILEHLAKDGRVVRLPANKINGLSKLEKKIALLEQKLGRVADISEIVDEFGDIDKEEVHLLESLSNSHIDSLDREISHDENSVTTLGDVIADESVEPTDHLLTSQNLKNEVAKIVGTLKPRDRDIMIDIFGLNGSYPMPLAEVAKKLNISREMVRQIKEKNLVLLRKRLRNSNIKSYQ